MKPSNDRRVLSGPFRVDSLGPTSLPAPDQQWLWRGYLAPGQLTLLTSLWKSGKTTLLAVLLARLRAGGELLGQPVHPARALVLSEEQLVLWHLRQERLPLGEHVRLICRPFHGKPTDADWRALLEQSAGLLGTEGGRLLVVDTVSALMPAGTETNAAGLVRALDPLRRLAAQGVAIGLLHHPHKGKARPGEWSRGSGALPASVDIVLEMHPCCPDDLYDRRRLLLGWSRHPETPRRQLIEWTADGGDYRVLAETLDVAFERGWSAIREVLSDLAEPQTAAAILRQWPAYVPPPSRATLHRWLARAVELHWLRWEASHRRSAPYQYWLPDAEAS
jgi:AAA domain